MSRPPRPAVDTQRRSLCLRGSLGWLTGSLLAPLAACVRAEPWLVGFLGGLSGRAADLGIGGRNGAQLAVDDLNAAGGVGGRRIEWLVRDDEQNDDVARLRVRELIDAGVQLVIGPMTSSVAMAVLPVLDQRGLPCVSPSVTTPELSGKRDVFFRVVSDATRSAGKLVEYLVAQGHRSVAIATDLRNKAFTQSWSQSTQRRLAELGGRVVVELPFESAPGLEFSEIARTLARAGADVVMLVASAADSALLIQHVRRQEPRVQLATSTWGGTEQLVELGGKAADGTIVPQSFNRNSRAAAYLAFAERYRQRFNEAPGFPAMRGYDAVTLAAQAMAQQRGGQTLLDSLRAQRTVAALQQQLVLDEFGDTTTPAFLTRVRDGQYEVIDPQ